MSDTKEGMELEKLYRVAGHPSFVMMNAQGEVMDWWAGYRDPQSWVSLAEGALADPTTLDAKFVRLAWQPTAKDAAALARIKAFRGQRSEALALYSRAQIMDPAGQYQLPIFEQVSQLAERPSSGITLADVKRTADAALAVPGATMRDKMNVAMTMQRTAEREKDMTILAPYLSAALDASRDATDPPIVAARQQLQITEALSIKKDRDLAVRLKREAMPEGWMTNADALNEFAWWCFENDVNLEEAEALARKGVELSAAGPEKAQVLDTLAEICHARGKTAEALELMREAVKVDPNEEHYASQVERFQKALGSKT